MAIDTASQRSRRALLAAALGAGVATVASALGRPAPVRGADGAPLIIGKGWNTATNLTGLKNTLDNETAFHARNDHNGIGLQGTSVSGPGVYGSSDSSWGVWGRGDLGLGIRAQSISGSGLQALSDTGRGIVADSNSNFAIHGTSKANVGVVGGNFATDKPAIVGHSAGKNTGVFGFSGSSAFPAARANTGVYGKCDAVGGTGVYGSSPAGRGVLGTSDSSTGVTGSSVSGMGVVGSSNTSWGVYGDTTSGVGVHGFAASGTAGLFATEDAMKGIAFRAVGRVMLDKCAGVATIAATKSSVVVTPGIDLVSTSAVVATLQGSAGSATTTVSRCFVNTTTNTFTIYLTKAATQNVKVAWHVFG